MDGFGNYVDSFFHFFFGYDERRRQPDWLSGCRFRQEAELLHSEAQIVSGSEICEQKMKWINCAYDEVKLRLQRQFVLSLKLGDHPERRSSK